MTELSQGSAETYLRCGGKIMQIVGNFIPFSAVKEL